MVLFFPPLSELEQFKYEVERLRDELRRAYFITGLIGAICLIIGFLIGYKLWREF